MSSSGRFEYSIGFKTDSTGLQEAKKQLQELKNLSQETAESLYQGGGKGGASATLLSDLQNAKDAAASLESAFNRAANTDLGSVNVSRLNKELKALPLKQCYDAMARFGAVGTSGFTTMAAQALKMNTYVKQGNALVQAFGKTLRRNLEWLISGNLINSVISVFTKAYGYTKNLDASLNDIRIVTGKSADEMERFADRAQDMAKELGKTTTDVTNASLIFFQQGLDQKEVEARTEIATKMANVSGQSADQVADQMTAVWNGFKVGTDELERYADVMTAVAANTASSSSELAGSISKVASIANMTGVDMEQLTAMLSTVISVTRESPETVGTAFKTIFARINDLVEDGTDEFGVTLGRVSSHLAAMGIEILDQDGKLKDLGDTLTEVGDKWSTYSKEQQVAIAEQIGGKRQWGQVTALFDSWDKYKDTLNIATDSVGALQEQSDIYMDRTTAKLAQMTVAWEGVYDELLSTDNINPLIDGITKILGVVEKLVHQLGGAGPIIGSVAALMLDMFSDKLAQRVVTIGNNIKGFFASLKESSAATEIINRFQGSGISNETLTQMTVFAEKANNLRSSMTQAQKETYKAILDEMAAQDKKGAKLNEELEKIQAIQAEYGKIVEISDLDNTSMEDLQGKINGIQDTIKQIKELQSDGGLVVTNAQGKTPMVSEEALSHLESVQTKSQSQNSTFSADEANKINELTKATKKYNATLKQLNTTSDQVKKQKLAQELQQQQNNIKGLASKIDVTRGSFKKLSDEEKAAIKILKNFSTIKIENKSYTDLDKIVKQLKQDGLLTEKQLKSLNKSFNQIRADSSQEDINKVWAELEEKLKQSGIDLQNVDDAIKNNLMQSVRDFSDEMDQAQQKQKGFLSEQTIQQTVQGFAKMGSSVTQFHFALTSLKNMMKTLADPNASGFEKFYSSFLTITQLTSAAKSFYTGLSDITHALIAATTKLGANAVAAGIDAAAQTADEMATNANNRSKNKGALAAALNAIAAKKNAVAQGQDAVAQGVAKAATDAHTASVIALRVALFGVIGAIGAVAAAIAIKSTAEKAEAEMAQEARENLLDKEDELFNKHKEMITSNEQALKSFAEVGNIFAKYEEGSITIKELDSNLRQLIETLGLVDDAEIQHALAVAAYTGDYSKVNEIVKQRREDAINEQKSLLESAKNEAGAGIEKRMGETESHAEKFTDSTDHTYTDIIQNTKIANFRKKDKKPKTTSELNAMYTQSFSSKEDAEAYWLSGGTGMGQSPEELYNKYVAKGDNPISAADVMMEEKGPDGTVYYVMPNLYKYKDYGNGNEVIERALNEEEIKKIYGIDEGEEDSGTDTFNIDEAKEYLTGLSGEEKANTLNKWITNAKKIIDNDNSSKEAKQKAQDLYDIFSGWLGDAESVVFDEIDFHFTEKFNSSLESNDALAQAINDADTHDNANKMANIIDEQADELIKQYAEKGKELSKDEAIGKIRKSFLLVYPDKEDIFTKGEAVVDANKETVKKIQDSIFSDETKNPDLRGEKFTDIYPSFDLDSEKVNSIKENFEKKFKDLDFDSINWNNVISNLSSEDMIKFVAGDFDEIPNLLTLMGDSAQYASENLQQLTMDYAALGESADTVDEKLEKGTTSRALRKDKDFQNAMSASSELVEQNPELKKYVDILNDPNVLVNSAQWKAAWEKYKKALKNAGLEQPANDVKKFGNDIIHHIEELGKKGIDFKAKLDSKQFVTDVEGLIAASYEMDITINAQLTQEYEDFKNNIKSTQDLLDKIDDNYQTNIDNLDALVAKFPEIANGMTILADGTVQLSKEAVEGAKKEAAATVQTEQDAIIGKLKLQRELLVAKQESYKNMLDAAKKLSEGTITNDVDANKQLNTIQTEALKITQLNDAQLTLSKGEQINTQVINTEKGYSEQLFAAANYYNSLNQLATKGEADAAATVSNYIDTNTRTWKQILKEQWDNTDEALSSESFKIFNEDAFKSMGNTLVPVLQNAYDSAGDAIKDVDSLISRVGRTGISATNSLTKAVTDNTTAKEGNADATKEQVAQEAALKDLLQEEIDAYHDVTQQIERHTTALNRLQKEQEKLTGQDLIDNLKAQMKAVDDLNNDYEDQLRKQYKEAAIYRVQLEDEGITFDENGVISNYSDILNQKQREINNDLAWYNSLSGEEQEGYKEWIDNRQKEFDILAKNIEKYDSLWNKEIAETEDKISDNIDKIIELALEKRKQEVEIVIEKGSLKRAELELDKALSKVQEVDIVGNLAFDVKTLFSYYDSEEAAEIERYYNEMRNRYQAELATGHVSKMTQEAYKEALEQYTQFTQDMVIKTEETVSKSFERLNQKIERQKTQFETLNQILEHDINIVLLKYGDKAYEQLETLYKAKEKIVQAQITNANFRIQAIQQALLEAQRMNVGEDTIQKYEDELASSLQAQHEMVTNYLDLIKEQSDRTIDEIFDNLHKQIAGVSLEEIKDQWDWINEDSGDYYDTVNGAYEIEKLRNQIQKAINNTDSATTQKALNDLLDNEISNLQQKDKLSKYDIERAQALFDIEQKRAAFREAQNNKSKMRLRRDASGNYSYQFVSDEDRVATAMQDLADAQNKLYNIDKDSYKNNLDTLYRYWEEYQQKLKEAQTDEEVLKINQEYFDKMNDLIQEHMDRANNLQQTALEELADKTKATWENLTEIEKNNLMGEIVPMWTSAWAKMASDPNFLSLFSQAGIQVATEKTNYQAKIEGAIQENLGVSIDELASGEDPALKVIESAAITTEELTIELHNLVQILEDVVKLIAGEKIDISQISTLFNKENYQLDSIGKMGLSSTQEGPQAETLSALNTQYGWKTNSINQTLFSTSVEKTSDALDSIMFMSETVQFMSNQLNNFYTKQSRLLEAITTDANRILKGLITVPQAGNNNVTNINNIDANFPAVESAQEILVALTSLENQATQNAFNTYR